MEPSNTIKGGAVGMGQNLCAQNPQTPRADPTVREVYAQRMKMLNLEITSILAAEKLADSLGLLDKKFSTIGRLYYPNHEPYLDVSPA